MRDHGGNLDNAIARYGGGAADWIDLSTGINRVPFPLPPVPAHAWCDLPTAGDLDRLSQVAAAAYDSAVPPLPLAGAQAAIQIIPRIVTPGRARVLAPTYNEHAACLRAAGWQVAETGEFDSLRGADLAVVVNPNNPDGRFFDRAELMELACHVHILVVDESFADATPELSLSRDCGGENLVVLRSLGKFYGLAGVRLGFAIAGEAMRARMAELAGPWPVSGPAIEAGVAALAGRQWRRDTIRRLAGDVARLDALAARPGLSLVGGTALFRTYRCDDAAGLQEHLAAQRIWTRIFPWSRHWIRLGLPGKQADWVRLEEALLEWGER